MRGAFVVQIRRVSPETAGPMEGTVEEVDSGDQVYFRSEDELIRFLRRRVARKGSDEPGNT